MHGKKRICLQDYDDRLEFVNNIFDLEWGCTEMAVFYIVDSRGIVYNNEKKGAT